jgi:hypothetical protein
MATRIKVIKHTVTRLRQQENDPLLHHPVEKVRQIEYLLEGKSKQKVLELFCGQCNLTEVYKKYGTVEMYDKALGTGDSFKIFHWLIGEGKKYHVIDIDPYGFPSEKSEAFFSRYLFANEQRHPVPDDAKTECNCHYKSDIHTNDQLLWGTLPQSGNDSRADCNVWLVSLAKS